MTTPTDPERLARLQMFQGAHIALNSTYDAITELQIFHIDAIWKEGSPEWNASVNTLEGLKALIAKRIYEIQASMEGLLE